MPRPGGEADKLGNRYEGIWSVGQLLRMLSGEIESIVVEPMGVDSLGVEFVTTDSEGKKCFHSVKRQRAAGEWSLAALCSKQAQGRSIFSDLCNKLAADSHASACFVSSTGANELRELSE